MAKDTGKKDPIEKARRKLTKAQMELSVAQEEHAQARVRGKQEIEQARLRAAKWLTKTGKRVDRRVAAVAQAEDRMAALIAAPQAVADIAETVEFPADVAQVANEESDVPAQQATPALRPRALQALDVLRSTFGPEGATATEWQAAATMSEATFLRARKELIDHQLIVRQGEARRGARYQVQDPPPNLT